MIHFEPAHHPPFPFSTGFIGLFFSLSRFVAYIPIIFKFILTVSVILTGEALGEVDNLGISSGSTTSGILYLSDPFFLGLFFSTFSFFFCFLSFFGIIVSSFILLFDSSSLSISF